MIGNYHYFLVLAEELNISNAAKRLYISHQCLSKYLKGLEETYGVTFFERKPKFVLTHAGNMMLKTLREIERCEQNLESQLADIKESKSGTIKFGITEGRYPIIIPRLLKEYRDLYPNVELTVYSMTSRNRKSDQPELKTQPGAQRANVPGHLRQPAAGVFPGRISRLYQPF